MDSAWQEKCVRALVEISDEEVILQSPSSEAPENAADFGRWQRLSVRSEGVTTARSPSGEPFPTVNDAPETGKLTSMRQSIPPRSVISTALIRKRPEMLIRRKSQLTREVPQQTTPTQPVYSESVKHVRRRFEVVAPQALVARPNIPSDASKPRKRSVLALELQRKKPLAPTIGRTASLASISLASRILSPPSVTVTGEKPWTWRLRSQAAHSLLPLNPGMKDRLALY